MSYGAGAYDEISRYPLAGVAVLQPSRLIPGPTRTPTITKPSAAELLADNPDQPRPDVLTGGNNPFETYCWMTGLEEALVNLVARPEVVAAAMQRITGFYETRLRRVCERCGDLIDLVFIADDLGGQQGLLLSRRLYRKLLQPFHRRLTGVVHALAPQARTLFHTDGAVFDIVPDLIDAGVDVLEAVQTDAAGMDPERLKVGLWPAAGVPRRDRRAEPAALRHAEAEVEAGAAGWLPCSARVAGTSPLRRTRFRPGRRRRTCWPCCGRCWA